jgi:hypothetical protein
MRVCILITVFVSLAAAQTQTAVTTAVPPPEHPDLYYAYFVNGPSPSSVPVNSADMGNFVQLSAATAGDLAKLDQQRQSYLAFVAAHGKQPDPKTMMGFDAARALTTLGGLNKMRKGLSIKGWQNFHDWVNGSFRQNLGGH